MVANENTASAVSMRVFGFLGLDMAKVRKEAASHSSYDEKTPLIAYQVLLLINGWRWILAQFQQVLRRSVESISHKQTGWHQRMPDVALESVR